MACSRLLACTCVLGVLAGTLVNAQRGDLIRGFVEDAQKAAADAISAASDSDVANVLTDFLAQDEDDLQFDIDLGGLTDGDFLSPFGESLSSRVANTVDRVTSIFTDAEDVSFKDLLKSPHDKFKDSLGLNRRCAGPGVTDGDRVPDSCVGPTFSFVIDGGVCVIEETTGEVVCSQPSISVAKTPAVCNLKYKEGCTVLGRSCVESKAFGTTRTRIVGNGATTIEVNGGLPFRLPDLDELPFDLDLEIEDVFENIDV